MKILSHKIVSHISRAARAWAGNRDGAAAVEAAMIFPIMLTLLLSVFDMGNALLTDQKLIHSSQVVGDLVTRSTSVTDAEVADDINAGTLTLMPENTATLGFDIVSISWDANKKASIVWRTTQNMTANSQVLNDVSSLAEANGGVVVVTTQYQFSPTFAGFIVGKIPMQEMAFTRGRLSAVVTKT